jgi:glycosyltransferase involved in cell wall biosynthesis
MESPTFTVLVTTYNYGRFVEQAIESVLSQEYPPEKIQIVVVDDGSTDDTSERVKKYGSRIEYFVKQNGGQASALNFGLAKARGEIVALLDADDVFVPSKLARVAEAFQKNPGLGLVYHQLIEWDNQTNERRALNLRLVSGDLRDNPEQVLKYFVQPASCAAFRRATLQPLLPIPDEIRMLADAFLIILVPLISPILALQDPLTLYRIHGSNSYYVDEKEPSAQTRLARGGKIQTLIEALLKWVAANRSLENREHTELFTRRWSLLADFIQFESSPPGRWRSFFFLVRQNYLFRSCQSWKFSALKYLAACSAIIWGYRKALALQNDLPGHLKGRGERNP